MKKINFIVCVYVCTQLFISCGNKAKENNNTDLIIPNITNSDTIGDTISHSNSDTISNDKIDFDLKAEEEDDCPALSDESLKILICEDIKDGKPLDSIKREYRGYAPHIEDNIDKWWKECK